MSNRNGVLKFGKMVAGEDIRKFFLLERTIKLSSCDANQNMDCLEVEKEALLKFKQGLTDPSDLNKNNFEGMEIPKFIGSLGKLRYLNLSGASFGGLSSLKYLNLGGIDLRKATAYWLQTVNTLPSLLELHMPNCQLSNLSLSLSFLNFTSLSVLHLSNNGFDSTIPHWLSNLSSLVYLDLNSNNLQGGLLDAFQNFISLQLLDLSKNLNIEGKLLRPLGNWCYLRTLILSVNKLSGEITEFLDGLSACSYNTVENLDLGFNKLTGNLPNSLGHLKNLSSIMNQMSGIIPDSLGELSSLVVLELNENSWEGTIPDWLLKLDLPLHELDIAYNQLSGRVPNSLVFNYLANVDLSSNLFDGPLPLWSSNVSTLYLRDNLFSGPIPQNIGEAMPIQTDLDISWNSLNGSTPLSMDMSNNSLSGTIPRSLGSLTTLRFLVLSNNNLFGELPSYLQNCSALESLDLGDNKFSRNIPSWIGESMSYLLILALQSNFFRCNIPLEICALSALHILDLSHNHVLRFIPPCFGNLSGFKSELSDDDLERFEERLKLVAKGRALEYYNTLYLVNSLDLSNNSLSGEIPIELTSLLKLGTLNLSSNNLGGNIPEKIGNL
ncbi:LRR receptor-like serine/threonine-protein kinase GSO2 [Vitis vinifera]|uniref:LRR receptor-like serine/threonine-protein kinase GSO2 n=1 Tax=Vitis vinifera TaxID=29760 RepID=A0A438H7S2_VITVI|nr:LRR receptor-like serine/threonine-protein kinase GSO2 [Vitis vinifera]